MAYNNSIQPSLPPDTGESPSLGASRIRNLKSALIERLNSWIYGFDTTGVESEIGVKSVPLRNQGTAPSTPTCGVELYAKSGEAYIKDTSGNEVQITNSGVLGNVGTYESKNINTEYLADKNLFLITEFGTITIASDINFTSVILSTGSVTAVVPIGAYYRVASASSGTYKVISI
jgi:hypothetical protein